MSNGSELDALRELARAVFADHPAVGADDPQQASPETAFDPTLWSVLDEAGLTRLSLPEDAGGSGAGLVEAGALLAVAGEHAAAAPLAETDLLGAWLLNAAGILPVAEAKPAPPLTAVAADPGQLTVGSHSTGATVHGAVARVPWARCASTAVVLAGGPDGDDLVLAVDTGACRIEHGRNLAGEPRDRLVFDGATAVPAAPAPAGARDELRRRGALARAAMLSGAAAQALSLTVAYAGEREQFGRPISRFQAVAQQVAQLAGEVAAAQAAVDAALHAAAGDGLGSPRAALCVAMAKAQASASAAVIARAAHQVHGAIGFTMEHRLRLATTRLWSWRDEFGNETEWHAQIGAAVRAGGADGVWPLVTQ